MRYEPLRPPPAREVDASGTPANPVEVRARGLLTLGRRLLEEPPPGRSDGPHAA